MSSARYSFVFIVLVLPLVSRAAVLPFNGGSANGGGVAPGPTGGIYASLTTPFVAASFTGSVQTDVYANDATNLSGGLTFVYTINATTGNIGRATVTDYAGLTVDATTVAGAGVVPNAVTRNDLVSSGDVVGWNFQDANFQDTLLGGTSTVQLVLRTSSHNFAPNTASFIDGSSTSVSALGPAAGIIPEPSTLGLIGVAGLAALRRRAR